MAQTVFTLTIFVSAFMLFLVQPLIGKLILPKLGGTPQVWNTCMVFFQTALLAGYAYTHTVSTRLKLRQQLIFHAVMLGVPILTLLAFPMYAYVQGWSPPTEGNPIPTTLILLATVVGVPFFVVSTSAPLLQKWFAYSGHPAAKDPYFLYSASNAGSLLSLLFYPAGIEPFAFLQTQTYIWFGGYILLAALIVYCAFLIFKTAPSDEQLEAEAARETPPGEHAPEVPGPAPAPVTAAEASTGVKAGPAPATGRGIQRKKGAKVGVGGKAEDEAAPVTKEPLVARGATAPMTPWRRIRWVLLAAVPSSLMLGVTSYISTDLSPFPLVWVIPLALYLLSFILVYMKTWTSKRYPIFSAEGYTLHQMMLYVGQPLGLIVLCFIVLTRRFDPFFATGLAMLGFFTNALACHGELAEDRPSTKHLTEYFLLMSVGGAIGGMFNGIIAPVVFQRGVLEFYIAIVIACMVRPQYVPSGWFDELILQAFPGLQTWFRNQGDEMAKSMGRPAPQSTYMFSYILDVIFGLFILSLAYWLKVQATDPDTTWLRKLMKSSGLPESFAYNAVIFGIPMVFCFFFAGRPLRFGLATLGLFLGSLYLAEADDRRVLEARRTYFGILRVQKDYDHPRDEEEKMMFRREPVKVDGELRIPPFPYTFLMHGTTYHGRNYIVDAKDKVDLSRLATTYYHRYGPVGIVMEQDNWFKGAQNSYAADARGPASIVGQVVASLGVGTMPLPAIASVWAEPPFATIGLGTGTMAGYARPFQHMTYYEIDEVIRHFSLPEEEGKDAHFTFLENAIRRGVNMEVIMGDARQSLEPKRELLNFKNRTSYVYQGDFKKFTDKNQRFYAKAPYKNINLDSAREGWLNRDDNMSAHRDKYYKVIVVDAFSSDAIPIHLCTLQAVKIYMDKLRDDGVLCMHTSNRHMDLVRPVARIALELNKQSKAEGEKLAAEMTFKNDAEREAFLKKYEVNCLVGKDSPRREHYMGHFGSEYVMIYRGDGFKKWTDDLRADKEKLGDGPALDGRQILNSVVEWYDPYKDHTEVRGGRLVKSPITMNDSLWTDDYSFILGVLR